MYDFAPHNMTSNILPVPYVASASSAAGGNLPYLCFDGLILAGYAWISDLAATSWLKIDLGANNTHKLDTYDITFATGQPLNYAPRDWTMEGSNNDSDWDVLDTVTGETAWAANEKRTFECDVKTTSYRYFKLNMSLSNTGSRFSIAELHFWAQWIHHLAGTVKEKGNPVVRTLFTYFRSTGAFFDSASSEEDGSFSIGVPDSTTEMFVVCLDDDAGDQYNALIYDRVKGALI